MQENKIYIITTIIGILYLILKTIKKIYPNTLNHRKQFQITSQKNKKKNPEE